MSFQAKRLLFIRPDTYGDLILFEPVLRFARQMFPKIRLAVLIREPYADLAPLIGVDGIEWLTTACNPYKEGPRDNRIALETLRTSVQAFAPDSLVAACYERTWLEAVVASWLPEARQLSLGANDFDPLTRAMLEAQLKVDCSAMYLDKILVEVDSRDWEKNIRLAAALKVWADRDISQTNELGREIPPLAQVAKEIGIDLDRAGQLPAWWPHIDIPEAAQARAREIFAERGVEASQVVVCCPAGTANVEIKSWPGERFGETVAWLQRECGIRTLFLGHENECDAIGVAQKVAQHEGADPLIWLGRTGEIATAAGLLAHARCYFGNDTGLLHLAAALGRSAVSIFGGGHWPRFKPMARRSAVVVQPLPCFGCAWNCLFGYAPCVKEIPTKTVREALGWLLASDENAEKEFAVTDAIPEAGLALMTGAVAAHRHRSADGFAAQSNVSETLVRLLQQLDFSETDRAARLITVDRQGLEIARLQSEVDRWLKEAEELWPQLNEAKNARNQLASELEEFRKRFAASEADRAARLQVIEAQAAQSVRLQDEVDGWLTDLRSQLAASEADRAARLEVIEAQGAENVRLHGEVKRWLDEASELSARLNAAENAHNLSASELEGLRSHFVQSQSENEELRGQNRTLQSKAVELESEIRESNLRHKQDREKIAELQTWRERVHQHWAMRMLRMLHLGPE